MCKEIKLLINFDRTVTSHVFTLLTLVTLYEMNNFQIPFYLSNSQENERTRKISTYW